MGYALVPATRDISRHLPVHTQELGISLFSTSKVLSLCAQTGSQEDSLALSHLSSSHLSWGLPSHRGKGQKYDLVYLLPSHSSKQTSGSRNEVQMAFAESWTWACSCPWASSSINRIKGRTPIKRKLKKFQITQNSKSKFLEPRLLSWLAAS